MSEGERKNAWLHSFLDIVLLLICFFVMIFAATRDYSMNEQEIIYSVRERFSTNVDRGDIFGDQGVFSVMNVLNSKLKNHEVNDYIDITSDANQISIIIPYKFLLKDGELTKEAVMVADFFVEFLFNVNKNKVNIINLVDLDSLMMQKVFIDKQKVVDYSLKSLIKLEKLFRDKGLSDDIIMMNKFSPIRYKAESIYNAVQINIYSD